MNGVVHFVRGQPSNAVGAYRVGAFRHIVCVRNPSHNERHEASFFSIFVIFFLGGISKIMFFSGYETANFRILKIFEKWSCWVL